MKKVAYLEKGPAAVSVALVKGSGIAHIVREPRDDNMGKFFGSD